MEKLLIGDIVTYYGDVYRVAGIKDGDPFPIALESLEGKKSQVTAPQALEFQGRPEEKPKDEVNKWGEIFADVYKRSVKIDF
ncbi:hypothetical protein KKC94_03665 [Patescibacteria group bacterium]|nr:hypothetical protein [Patescibacteria group bacterium]